MNLTGKVEATQAYESNIAIGDSVGYKTQASTGDEAGSKGKD